MKARANTAARSKRNAIQPFDVVQVDDALLTMRTACFVSGLSESTIYRKAKHDADFPRLVRIGARCTRIRAGDLKAWLRKHAGAAE